MQIIFYSFSAKIVEVPEGHIFNRPAVVDEIVEGCKLEDIPNRDSTKYMEVYNIHSATTVYRGTLRYQVHE